MSRATALLSKVNSTLAKVTPMTYVVYKRTIVRSGGNDLIGRAGSTVTTDIILAPQPYYTDIGRKKVSGGHDPIGEALSGSTERVLDDYKFLISPTALSLSELQNPNLQLVFKDSSGTAKELLEIHDFEVTSLQGVNVLITLFAKSIKRF